MEARRLTTRQLAGGQFVLFAAAPSKKQKSTHTQKKDRNNMFEIVTPAVIKRSDRNVPSFSAFLKFLDSNPGHWCMFYTYANCYSGNQQAYRANKKYKDKGYTFTSRKVNGLVSVYGKKNLEILD